MDGGANLISCQNVTNNPLDFCCDSTTTSGECCTTGVGRFQIPNNEDVLVLGSAGALVSTYISTFAVTSTISATPTSQISSSTTFITSSTTAGTPVFGQASISTASSKINLSPQEATPTPTSAFKTQNSGPSSGAKIGIGIGTAAFAFVVFGGGLAYYFVRKQRTIKRPEANATMAYNTSNRAELIGDHASSNRSGRNELVGSHARSIRNSGNEQSATREAGELESQPLEHLGAIFF